MGGKELGNLILQLQKEGAVFEVASQSNYEQYREKKQRVGREEESSVCLNPKEQKLVNDLKEIEGILKEVSSGRGNSKSA